MEKKIDFKKIEAKWQERWAEKKVFEVKESRAKKKFYVLEMYPYPSASGLHMGHAFNYTIGDIYARFKRMNGFNVLYPMGYDSFGLPAENAAIKNKSHPKKFTESAVKNYIKQQKNLGLSYDWSRMVSSMDPDYYKWNQYFFLKFLENGLVYRKKSPVNWCRECNTVLANEQVHNGKCWRHKDIDVETKQLEQWFLKTTKYAEELLDKVDDLQWPERIKEMQKNWIGKSYGYELEFEINGEKWPIFTTRPDTLFGVTFMVVSAQHPRLMELVTEEQNPEVEKFLKKIKSTSQKNVEELEKEGAFTGSFAVNPATGEKVPIWTGNFVVADYGSGMVMAVPAHDQRDFEFAKKYGIPHKVVIMPPKDGYSSHELSYYLNLLKIKTESGDFVIPGKKREEAINTIRNETLNGNLCYIGKGILGNSGEFNGLPSQEAIEKIGLRFGKKTINYKLRDWLVSRQRYWGTPIPIIYCEKCGIVPVPEKNLPVLLPEKVTFGEGNPLLTNKEFVNISCPKCGSKAKRETDTMDTFFDSSWYYLRYCDNKNQKEPFKKEIVKYWMPVDQYIGGAEHACMHLIYARFFTKALRDLGYLSFDEPFTKLFNQGMLHGNDGAVMSKSGGNVVLPEEVSEKYGIDTARVFLVSLASPDKDLVWSDNGVEGTLKFIEKVFKFFSKFKEGKSDARTEHKVNKTVRDVSDDIEKMKYNMAVIKLRELFDSFGELSGEDAKKFVKLLAPFAPHIAEELWEKVGGKGFVSLAEWPSFDEKKINENFDKAEEALDKTVRDILNILKIVSEKSGTAEKVYLYVLPNEIGSYDAEGIGVRVGKKVKVFAVNAKEKYDPQGKAAKAKPGKPAIYVE